MATLNENDPIQPTPQGEITPEPAPSQEPPTSNGQIPAEEPTDAETERAVDEIMKQDGDEVLRVQDAAAEKAVVMHPSWHERFKNAWASWWSNPKKRYGTLGALVAIIGILMAIPLTRYDILGLVLKQQVTVVALDSKDGAPVSGALVTVGGASAKTEANGKATLRAHLGSKTLQITKKYYQSYSHKQLVSMSASHNVFKASVVALGQQVQVKVTDKVTGQALSGATISVNGAQTKTNKKGLVSVVIPSSANTQKANISLGGYNTLAATITAGGNVSKNTFSLTPAGKLYFLSNLSGKIDVIKTNLDGTARQTVLAGTGNEQASTTSLLASRDWKYLALLAKRSSDSNSSIYLIDTTNGDKLTTIDQGAASFSLVGWSDDNFVYQMTRSAVGDWQSNQQALKSFDATTGKTLLLDQTQASGTSSSDYIKQYFGTPYLVSNQLVYAKNWSASYNNWSQLSAKQAELDSIGSNGSGHKVVKTFALASGSAQTSTVWINTELYEPNDMYIYFNDGNSEHFYDYSNGQIKDNTTLTSNTFYSTPYPTFLLSPSGNQTFWAEQRDGKNTLFVGDNGAQHQKQVATLSEYNTYGWYTDGYLLVSKSNSELYIMSSSGGTPLKITDYYKPAINYNGYGGGYGGL